jgi:hypothetical protein
MSWLPFAIFLIAMLFMAFYGIGMINCMINFSLSRPGKFCMVCRGIRWPWDYWLKS